MTRMIGDDIRLFIFLGDSGLAAPFAALAETLPEVAQALGWDPCDEAKAERVWCLGPRSRWVRFADSAFEAATRDLDGAVGPLATALSVRWPVAVVRRSEGVLTIVLYKEGVVADRYANRALEGEQWPGDSEGRGRGGDPSRWADLLGTPRNAMRLESVWGSWSDAEEVLQRTAAIVGWDVDESLDGDDVTKILLCRR